MNPQVTLVLAVLVNKKILSEYEAKLLSRRLTHTSVTDNVGEMIKKVEGALAENTSEIKTIDANDLINK